MKQCILFLTAFFSLIFASPAIADAVNGKPFVVPQLREWEGAEGTFQITKSTKIVCADKSSELAEVASQFAADYENMFGSNLRVTNAKSSNGDIVLSMCENTDLGKEGYTISITSKVEVTASTTRGLLWATRTLLQIAEQNAQTLPKGKITDYPDYELRCFMLDVGRKFVPIQFLHDYVDLMAYYKMNTFHIHLNDNADWSYFDNDWMKTPTGFRLESDFFPGLASRDGYYTKEEFIELQKHAERVGVEIIPEIDTPAHSLAFTQYRPELASKDYGMNHLDLFKDETYSFVDSLFLEYLGGDEPVFIGPRFHVGTDEYSNKDSLVVEQFRYFTDHCIREAEKYGKQACVWGALSHARGKTPVKVDNVLMYGWNNRYANPTEMMKLGYDMLSIHDRTIYIVPAAGYYYDFMPCKKMYETWTPASIGNQRFEEKHPQIKGGGFALWNDMMGNGISAKDIHYRSLPAVQTLCTKMWTGAEVDLPFEEYDRLRQSLSDGPGVNIAGRYTGENRTLIDIPVVKPAADLYKKTGIREIGYEYSVSFNVEYNGADESGTELFISPDAVFYLADPVEGKLGFSRDGYLNTFNYKFYPGEKANVTICGDMAETSLYINDKHVETLDKQPLFLGKTGRKKMYYVRTLVFPLSSTGKFKSKVTDLQVKNYLLHGEVNPEQVSALLDRVGGKGTSDRIDTKLNEALSINGEEVFEIYSRNGKPFIQGSSISALTSGIGWYLNHYARVNLSWNNLTTDLSKVNLPVPLQKETRRCSADYRYYLNYCTFSYSMAFWTKERWEQEVDWMALHGINMPLMLVGTDVVWKNMLEEAGYSRADIDNYIAGPGFHAWWLMNNLEGWGGPNPDWWYQRQEQLSSFILTRMRDLGMEPVLPGYSGMLPSNAAEKLGVSVADPGLWGGGFQRPAFLLPTDEKFNEIAQLYYKHLEKVMGKSKYYSMDPFHEGGSTEGVDLNAAFDAIYTQMPVHSPGSKWVMQGWGRNPRKEALATVPKGGLVVLDLFSDGRPRWQEGYQGHEFIWCMLHNFGGKIGIQGRLDATMNGYFDALAKFPANMKGVGATMEGIETNPILYDALFELPWMTENERKDWISRWSEARYGAKNDNMVSAWKTLSTSVYDGPAGQQSDVEAVICARPALEVKKVSGWGTSRLYYDVQPVRDAAALMLKEKERLAGNPNYRYDLADVVRQTLTDSTYYLLKDIVAYYEAGDMDGFRTGYEKYLEMIKDVDRLTSQSEMFTLDRWVNSARAVCDEVPGLTDSDRDWMEWNARTLVSVWGPEVCANKGRLHDYSHRVWGGMLRDFYLPRWEKFFKSLDTGVTITPQEWFEMEEEWSRSTSVTTIKEENPIDVAQELFHKYFAKCEN